MGIEKWLVEVGLSAVGIGLAVAYLWQKLERVWFWAANLEQDDKRIAVFMLGFLTVQPIYWFAVLVEGLPMPDVWTTWLSQTFGYALSAFAGSTLFHGVVDKGGDPAREWHLARAIDGDRRLR